jgi:hypothetical protein
LCVPKWPNDLTLPAMSWKDTANNAKNDARKWCHRLILRFESSTTTTTHPLHYVCVHLTVVWLSLPYEEKEKPLFFLLSFFFFSFPTFMFVFEGLFFFALFYFLVMFSPNRAETLIFDEIVRRPHYKNMADLNVLIWNEMSRGQSRK